MASAVAFFISFSRSLSLLIISLELGSTLASVFAFEMISSSASNSRSSALDEVLEAAATAPNAPHAAPRVTASGAPLFPMPLRTCSTSAMNALISPNF
ncbi:Uncharacterised protein [Mycobacteroides abscessus subsp. abscessus]|nr:Uncharacterised protein [Mycobacteroides abscessus subsp. abscessus]